MGTSKKQELEILLQDIRQCKFCKRDADKTPFVYGAETADILVVSEIPSKTAWNKNEGAKWETEGIDFRDTGQRKTVHNILDILGISPEEARRRIFWIQRANCYIKKGEAFAFQHCSARFIDKAIDAVQPNIVVTVGKRAAEYFHQFGIS